MNQHQHKPVVTLIGYNGNAFMILARCQAAARAAGWRDAQIAAMLDEMKAGDYDHLLQVAMTHFEVK